MKKLFLAGVFVLGTMTLQAQDVIVLNSPDLNRGTNIMQALQNRKSSMDFSYKKFSVQDLSDLMWAANGINRPETGKKTAPSAQNSQDIDMYICSEEGAYLYNATENRLEKVAEGDLRVYASRPNSELPPYIIYLVGDISRYNPRNDKEHVLDMIKVDAGIVSQNISLFCAGCGFSTKPRAGMDQEQIRKALNLTDSQLLILNHPVGYSK